MTEDRRARMRGLVSLRCNRLVHFYELVELRCTLGVFASARRMWAKSLVATRLETRTKESNRCASGKVANLGA